jgi:hypothetical protein
MPYYKRLSLLMLIVAYIPVFNSILFSQDSKFLQGGPVEAKEVSIQSMEQLIGPVYYGEPKEKQEGEPPYAPKQPAPDAWQLPNVTYDKSNNFNQQDAPVLGTGFEGITQGQYIPSEPSAAAGPTQIFSPGNVSVTITNKDGSNRVEISGITFFGVPSGEGAISDAVCCYDALRGRFVTLCFTQGNARGKSWSNFYLMISKTSDARGAWWQYKFDWRVDGNTLTSNWGDFQEFGFSGDKFVMSSQQFAFKSNSYKYQKLRVIDINTLYNGGPVSWVDFVNFPAPPGGDISNLFVTKPGRNLTAGDNTIYLLTTRYSGGSNVAYRTLTGTPSSPVLSSGTLVSVNSYGASVNAKGGSGTATVNAGDCRTPNFIVRNGALHIAWHFGINFGSGTVDAVRYLKLDVTNINSPVKITDETFGANNIYYYYPSCTADNSGNMFIGFGRSSATEYPSSWVSGKLTTDASIQPSALAKSGIAVTSQSRWGDFTGIDMDESASGSTQSIAWYAGQWTKGSNTFGTWVSQLTFTFPAPANVTANKPKIFEMRQNYPNPFNPTSSIKYEIPFDANVYIKVFDITGREVATLVNTYLTAGYYTAGFDGSRLASGIYFYKMIAKGNSQNFEKTMKMVLTK